MLGDDTPKSPTGEIAPEGGGNDPTVASFFEVANDLLGTQFKDDDSAKKYLKDNIAFINEARKIQKEASLVDPSKFVPIEKYETDTFFNANPDFAAPAIRKVIESLRVVSGKPLADVVQSDDFKAVFSKYKAGDEFEKSKSVLESNPRIGVAVDQIQKARDAQAKGDQKGAEDAALAAVLEIGK